MLSDERLYDYYSMFRANYILEFRAFQERTKNTIDAALQRF